MSTLPGFETAPLFSLFSLLPVRMCPEATHILNGNLADACIREQYNYVLSVALDVGTALSALFIFTVLGLAGASVKWWGTQVFTKSELTPLTKSINQELG
jgi:hypothetical protein